MKTIKRTLLLDEYTIDKLKIYGESTSGSENISNAVRTMVREKFKVEIM